jgi:hypothetical protein
MSNTTWSLASVWRMSPALTVRPSTSPMPLPSSEVSSGRVMSRSSRPVETAMSQFHQLKWPTLARSASPVGDAAEATTVPLPSCFQMPVVSSSDQSGIESPTTTGVAGSWYGVKIGSSIVALRPGARLSRRPPCVRMNSVVP